MPVNRGGEFANTGQAYIFQALWAKAFSEGREFIGVEMLENLQSGTSYRVEFYLSMADSVWYAVGNVGAHFSTVPHSTNTIVLLDFTPQVAYAGDSLITEKEGWVKVSGSFVAQGGERYLAIGNFDTDAETDTAFVPGGGSLVGHSPGHWDVAAYYIDDVSVVPDSIYLGVGPAGNSNSQEVTMEVFPNPTVDNLIMTSKTKFTQVWLTDLAGRRFGSLHNQGDKWQINLKDISIGVYLVVAITKEGNRSVKRVLVH